VSHNYKYPFCRPEMFNFVMKLMNFLFIEGEMALSSHSFHKRHHVVLAVR
jgi:hypothetical protein